MNRKLIVSGDIANYTKSNYWIMALNAVAVVLILITLCSAQWKALEFGFIYYLIVYVLGSITTLLMLISINWKINSIDKYLRLELIFNFIPFGNIASVFIGTYIHFVDKKTKKILSSAPTDVPIEIK
jgi:uncharacterized membrane protein